MNISKNTNLLDLFYKHGHGHEAKRIINEVVGHDYFPKMFNSSTAFFNFSITFFIIFQNLFLFNKNYFF